MHFLRGSGERRLESEVPAAECAWLHAGSVERGPRPGPVPCPSAEEETAASAWPLTFLSRVLPSCDPALKTLRAVPEGQGLAWK